MSRFTIPRDLYYGDNAMEELKNLKGYKKAIIRLQKSYNCYRRFIYEKRWIS